MITQDSNDNVPIFSPETIRKLINESCKAIVDDDVFPKNMIACINQYKENIQFEEKLVDAVNKFNYKTKDKFYAEYYPLIVSKSLNFLP